MYKGVIEVMRIRVQYYNIPHRLFLGSHPKQLKGRGRTSTVGPSNNPTRTSTSAFTDGNITVTTGPNSKVRIARGLH